MSKKEDIPFDQWPTLQKLQFAAQAFVMAQTFNTQSMFVAALGETLLSLNKEDFKSISDFISSPGFKELQEARIQKKVPGKAASMESAMESKNIIEMVSAAKLTEMLQKIFSFMPPNYKNFATGVLSINDSQIPTLVDAWTRNVQISSVEELAEAELAMNTRAPNAAFADYLGKMAQEITPERLEILVTHIRENCTQEEFENAGSEIDLVTLYLSDLEDEFDQAQSCSFENTKKLLRVLEEGFVLSDMVPPVANLRSAMQKADYMNVRALMAATPTP